MAGEKLPFHTDVNEVNERLHDGIETCRSVIANYRSLLSDPAADGFSSAPDGESQAVASQLPNDEGVLLEGRAEPQ